MRHIIYDKNLDIKYNYFEYIKNTYSINKNFGPESDFLLDLSVFLKTKLCNGNKIKVYINDGTIRGEADYKILKHIEENNISGDICIHSCDSDFLYFIILYQLKNENKYINMNFVKYYNNNYQLFNGKNLIELFTNKYKLDNNISDNIVNLNFLYDTMFFIQMFGNDLIPDNFEITGDINLSIYFNCHYKLYKNNNFIININDNDTINFNNLLLFLNELKNYNLFTFNILSKFFKIPKKIIYIFVKDLKYNIKDFILKIVIPYLKYEANELKDDIDSDDIRYKYIKKTEDNSIENNLFENPLDKLKLSNNDKIYLKSNFKNIFDYLNKEDYGLIRLTTNYELNSNPYQSLYNYIVNNSLIETLDKINKNFKHTNLVDSYEEYIDYTKDVNVKNYFDILFNQTNILFYDFKNYNPECKIYCKYSIAPTIESIINFINNNDYYSFDKVIYSNLYFNKKTHHLFITPYLLDNLDFIDKDDKYLINILNIMNKHINNLFDINKINLREINPDLFLANINELFNIFNNNNIQKVYESNIKLLINK
jgi:hypothetical protein